MAGIVLDGPVLRVTRVRNVGSWSTIDTVLRDEFVPGHRAHDGLIASWVGRHGPELDDERVIATVWVSAEHERSGRLVSDPFAGPDVAGDPASTSSVRQVVILERFHRPAPATTLRLYEGVTRSGELDAYIEEARRGVVLDGASPDGPVDVAMSVEPPDRFITVSTWSDWSSLERCTGGDRSRPLLTRNAARLVGGGPQHYELLG
jgi:hypothetical protein